MNEADHFFRHIKKSWTDGDFIDPAAFRLRENDDGTFENGLSINWVEYFKKPTPQEAIAPLVDILEQKKRTIGGQSRFALLNVKAAKDAARLHTAIAIVHDEEPVDPSHALVTGYAALNDEVAEEMQKVIIATYPAKPPADQL